MPMTVTARPGPGDFGEYYTRYISLVPPGNLVQILEGEIELLNEVFAPIPEARGGYAYAPGKWTLREVVGHLTDTERVFAYRATAFSRGDAQPLPGFDQAAWNPHGQYNDRTLRSLLDEWATARRASLALLRSMPEAALQQRGVASGFEITPLSCFCILAGHLHYHVDQLRQHYLA